jgi:hypothetical protein
MVMVMIMPKVTTTTIATKTTLHLPLCRLEVIMSILIITYTALEILVKEICPERENLRHEL